MYKKINLFKQVYREQFLSSLLKVILGQNYRKIVRILEIETKGSSRRPPASVSIPRQRGSLNISELKIIF